MQKSILLCEKSKENKIDSNFIYKKFISGKNNLMYWKILWQI